MSDDNPAAPETQQEGRRPVVVPEEHQKVVTEGQLKWAQFHYKRRARSVRQKVEEFWQTPSSSSDVEGALSDDGNTTEESFSLVDDDEEDEASRKLLRQKLKVARQNKPTISRGRRAMLRVSRRAFAKRQEEIQKYGFRCSDGDMDGLEEDNNDGDEALAAKFADETAWKKARRNRRQSRRRKAKSTEERLRRFENAFRAMMMSLAASQPTNPEIATPTKVWSRPEDAPAFVSIDGRQYRDLKWGVSASNEKVAQMLTTTDFASMPIDPRASWLVHIPSKPQDRALGGPDIPTNSNGELLVPENINGSGERMMPVPLGSDKFNEIVGTLQSQAQMSQQQMEEQLELMRSRGKDFKWQIDRPSQGGLHQQDEDEEDYEEDDEDEDEALDPEHLKTLAAQYLTEFVANADEEHLIAALGEQYRDDVDTLVEAAASDDGKTSTFSNSTESKEIVLKYLKERRLSKKLNTQEEQERDENEESKDNMHRNQMASFAGIAARYLAEVSRPIKIERTINSCRQEQGLIVKELKSLLDELYTGGSLPDIDKSPYSLDEANQRRIEFIIAKFAMAKGLLDGHLESEVVAELKQREGREFVKLLVQYLAKVKQSASTRKQSRNKKKSSRGSIASRYMDSLGKGKSQAPAQEEDATREPEVSEEQADFEQISFEIIEGLGSGEDVCDKSDIVSVLRKDEQSKVPHVVLKYLQALRDSVATGREKGAHRNNQIAQDYFAPSLSIFAQLGKPTTAEEASQRTFEAIISRYLSNIAKIGEDALFIELGKPERRGFSQVFTRHLDEIMVWEEGQKLEIKEGGPATRYLESLYSELPDAKSENEITQSDVEALVCQYLEKALSGLDKERFMTDVRQEQRANLSKLVSGYLVAVCESLPRDIEYNEAKQQIGAVAKHMESLNEKETLKVSRRDAGKGNVMDRFSPTVPIDQADGPSPVPSASAGNRRRSTQSEGVAAKYLSAVVDADDDDDIFAELRKQDSPKHLDASPAPGARPILGRPEFDAIHMPADHKLEAPDVLSPLSQSTGLPQVVLNDVSIDRKTAIGYVARIRPDCDESEVRNAIGNLRNTDQARAQFGREVTRLLMGVKDAANPKRSRAAASRYLAVMRGLPVEPDPDNPEQFESASVDEAAEILAECAGHGDPLILSRALRKIGRDDGERFAEFIRGYLTGNLHASGVEEEEDSFSPSVPIHAKQRHDSPGANSRSESEFFAGMRQTNANLHLDPFSQAKKLSYGPEEQPIDSPTFSEDKGSPDRSSTGKENVLKNTVNSFANRRDSYGGDPDEEKKSTQSLSGSSFDHSDNLPASDEGDAENIPFDPVGLLDGSDSTHQVQDVNSPGRSYASPSRSHASKSEFSPERLRDFHHSVMEKSALIGDGNAEQTIIDTDGTTSEASDAGMSPKRLAGLLLSPTILTKRHNQAVQAIKTRKWDQVSYLLSANPWLADMAEIRSNQYLLHKIAFYGAGDSQNPPAPKQLCTELIKMYPAVQKFDNSGCLPLHSASEAGNVRMIALLGDRFPSGASVRNEDGMLPLHLAIASQKGRHDAPSSLLEVVKSLLRFFPGALAVSDNAGNLPLHLAAKCLDGDEEIDVINLLLDESDKQLKNPEGVRFRNKPKAEEGESVTGTTASVTTNEVNSDYDDFDDQLPPSMVENDAGDIPLWIALTRSASPGVTEALAIGPGGRQSALKQDANGNSALHLAVAQDHVQSAALKCLLKVAPESALKMNIERMLPIEMACLKGAPEDVVLELLLVDLPIALSDKACLEPSGRGDSLWFLACECHDRYLGVIETLISMCSYQQVHELAFMTREDSRVTLISCASPDCGEFFTVSLLFVGRFEFLAYAPQVVSGDAKTFDALDYGTANAPYEEGRHVNLKCFTTEELYKEEIASLRSLQLDFDSVQQVSCFVVGGRDSYDSGGRKQFCVAVEQPDLTLDRVVAGMLKNDACRKNTDLRKKYVTKIFSVLRIVAKALHRLHSFGVVHGNLVPDACGKCGDRWKLLGTLGFQKIGEKFDANLFGQSVPPEALEPQNGGTAIDRQAAFRTNLSVDPSIDVWGFGKLSYDVLVGQALVEFDTTKELHQDHRSLLKLLHWSTLDLVEVRRCLREVGLPDSSVDLITKCLSPDPTSRPTMNDVLRSGPWQDMHHPPAPVVSEVPSDLHEC